MEGAGQRGRGSRRPQPLLDTRPVLSGQSWRLEASWARFLGSGGGARRRTAQGRLGSPSLPSVQAPPARWTPPRASARLTPVGPEDRVAGPAKASVLTGVSRLAGEFARCAFCPSWPITMKKELRGAAWRNSAGWGPSGRLCRLRVADPSAPAWHLPESRGMLSRASRRPHKQSPEPALCWGCGPPDRTCPALRSGSGRCGPQGTVAPRAGDLALSIPFPLRSGVDSVESREAQV